MSELHPQKITLTDEEEALLAQIHFYLENDASFDDIHQTSSDAASPLTHLLLSRNGIPKIRLHYFTKAEFNIGSKKSREEVFESNGTKGEAILNHAHFLPYLHYFIFGPQLPNKVIDDFWRMATKSDEEPAEIRKFSRDMTRQFSLNPRKACEEFFKLALECGLNVNDARSIRDAVKTIR